MSTLSRQKTWIAGDVLTASDLNTEFNNIINDYNGSINSSNIGTLTTLTFSTSGTSNSITVNNTGTGHSLILQDSGTQVFYAGDEGDFIWGNATTDNAKITQSTGVISFGGANMPFWMNNIALKRGTTSVAGDSITITSADHTAFSATNPGHIAMPGTTAGQITVFKVTADVTINMTGAHWGAGGGNKDITGALLRILAINDNGTLRWGVAYQGGRPTLVTTDTTATSTSATTPESVLCTAAVGSSTNMAREVGYVRADFDDTGGSSEDLWTIQSGVDDVVTGHSADGLWQPWVPVYTGFSVDPVASPAKWMSVGNTCYLEYRNGTSGTSNAVTFTMTAPVKALSLGISVGAGGLVDNGTATQGTGRVDTAANSTVLTMSTSTGSSNWTAANGKGIDFIMFFEMSP